MRAAELRARESLSSMAWARQVLPGIGEVRRPSDLVPAEL